MNTSKSSEYKAKASNEYKASEYKTMINDSASIYKNLDLDIDNYSDEDLENFLGLKKGYLIKDIEIKEVEMREKLISGIKNSHSHINGHNGNGLSFDKSLAKKIIEFLNETKEILIDNFKENPIIVGGGGNSFIIDKPQESITNFIQPINTFQSEIAPGILNKLRRGTTTVTMAMNTLFRDITGVSIPSDCAFTLSYTLKNVVSMKLLSIELPDKIYLLSNLLQNNVFFISDTGTGIQSLIIVPEGCYTQDSLAIALTALLNTTLNSSDYSLFIDPVSTRTIITNSLNNFELTFVVPGYTSQNMSKTLGWILGYRLPYYREQTQYVSESLYSGDALEYFYLVLDDYNMAYTSNLFAMFNDTYIDKNILAKIPYTNNNNNITNSLTYFDSNLNIISPKREYFGPVDIKKISIQLLNKYGDIVPLNLMDYSFTLEIEMSYDVI
jgi:hypothetical protein